MDLARRALRQGAPLRALEVLRNFQEDFPSSALQKEAVVLRIEALLGLGQWSEAEALAARFLKESPFDPQATRVRKMLAAQP